MSSIFISYRRIGALVHARALFERLRNEFGPSEVFIDLEGIDYGLDFVEILNEQLNGCRVMLALIDPQWATATDKQGRRRIEREHDYVRTEIVTALSRGIRTVPVLIDGAEMPDPEDLPDVLRPLTRRNALILDFTRFDAEIGRLIGAIRRILAVVHPTSAGVDALRDPSPSKLSPRAGSPDWERTEAHKKTGSEGQRRPKNITEAPSANAPAEAPLREANRGEALPRRRESTLDDLKHNTELRSAIEEKYEGASGFLLPEYSERDRTAGGELPLAIHGTDMLTNLRGEQPVALEGKNNWDDGSKELGKTITRPVPQPVTPQNRPSAENRVVWGAVIAAIIVASASYLYFRPARVPSTSLAQPKSEDMVSSVSDNADPTGTPMPPESPQPSGTVSSGGKSNEAALIGEQMSVTGNAQSGATKSLVCGACHGVNGISSNPQWPSLAGLPASYLVKQLNSFKDGKRNNPVMVPMVAGLSRQDIDDLAAYYSTLVKGVSAMAVPTTGEGAYMEVCVACHGSGINRAPRAGDKAAWAPLIAQGRDALYHHAIYGKGNMPPKGGTNWPDSTIQMAVDYMVFLAK